MVLPKREGKGASRLCLQARGEVGAPSPHPVQRQSRAAPTCKFVQLHTPQWKSTALFWGAEGSPLERLIEMRELRSLRQSQSPRL